MRRLLIAVMLLTFPSLVFAQTSSGQLTNDDLLRLIGMQQVQNLQCGKALEAAQQEIIKLTPEKSEKKREKKP